MGCELISVYLTTKEAVLSYRIEGTQATFEEVVEYQDKLDKKNTKFADIQEVMNYREALMYSVKEIETYPLSLPFIKKIHRILLDGVRGANKDRGNFRKTQNWIGPPGSSIENATYIPPTPYEMNTSLDNLEKYLHIDDIDMVVQVAIVHAQFEIIHPFLDGNGRIGRLLIPLFLYSKKILDFPSFYISEYFEDNKDEYYYYLGEITNKGDWNSWIEYFLKATIAQSNNNLVRVKKILALFDKVKYQIQEYIHTHQFMKIVEFIFSKPIFSANEFIDKTEIGTVSAYNYLRILEEKGLLVSNKKKRNRTYYFNSLLEIIG